MSAYGIILVYCLDRLPKPDHSFAEARKRVLLEFGGELHYAQIDVRDNKSLDGVIAGIAEEYERPAGLIAGTSSIPPFNPQTTSLCPAQTPSPSLSLWIGFVFAPCLRTSQFALGLATSTNTSRSP